MTKLISMTSSVVTVFLLLGCPSSQESGPREEQTETQAPSKNQAEEPSRPDAPPPGACAGQDPAPALACEVTEDSLTCRLTDPCVPRLVLKSKSSSSVRAWRWLPSAPEVGQLSLSDNDRALSVAHKQAPGTPLFVFLSNDIVSGAAETPYAPSKGGKALNSVRDGRKIGGGHTVILRVPGGAEEEFPEVVSGSSIGPVKMGMTVEELEGLGLSYLGSPTAATKSYGPYDVGFLDGRISRIEYWLSITNGGVRVGNRNIHQGASLEQAAAAFPNCGEVDRSTGGSHITCDDGKVMVAVDIQGVVTVRVLTPPAS